MSEVTCPACGKMVDEVYPSVSKKYPHMCFKCIWDMLPDGVMCSDNPQRVCDHSCAAFSVHVTARTVMRRDKTGAWSHSATRHPVFAPFCDKHRHPLVCLVDGESLEEPEDEEVVYQ